MSKIPYVFLAIIVSFFLTSCSEKEEQITPINPEDLITMAEVDDYMFRDDVQYVDLRNYEASFRSGFIYSFEMIPFFDYLDYRAFDRQDSYDFNPSQIINADEMHRLFDEDKAIFLYADGCIRSGYVKDVLNYLGYERVYILGGFGDYEGEHKILGDGYYSIGSTFYSFFYDEGTKLTYHIGGVYDLDRKITNVRLDIVDEFGVSLRSTSYDSQIDYNEQLTILENFIISDILSINEMYQLLSNDTDDQFDHIEGYTIGYEKAFIFSLYRLIAK